LRAYAQQRVPSGTSLLHEQAPDSRYVGYVRKLGSQQQGRSGAAAAAAAATRSAPVEEDWDDVAIPASFSGQRRSGAAPLQRRVEQQPTEISFDDDDDDDDDVELAGRHKSRPAVAAPLAAAATGRSPASRAVNLTAPAELDGGRRPARRGSSAGAPLAVATEATRGSLSGGRRDPATVTLRRPLPGMPKRRSTLAHAADIIANIAICAFICCLGTVISSSVASSSAHSTSSESDLELPAEGLAAKAPRTAHDLEDEQWDEYVDTA